MPAESEVNDQLKWAGGVVATVYRATTRDGAIDAFLRQGANELGAALKAFPDAIQVDEPGAVFNPLYSDIAADKRAANDNRPEAASALPSPSEIAGLSGGSVHGEGKAASANLPSPGEIAANTPPASPEQDHGQQHGRGM
jgi:hypothetical protein